MFNTGRLELFFVFRSKESRTLAGFFFFSVNVGSFCPTSQVKILPSAIGLCIGPRFIQAINKVYLKCYFKCNTDFTTILFLGSFKVYLNVILKLK